jgi:hypothetical protein
MLLRSSQSVKYVCFLSPDPANEWLNRRALRLSLKTRKKFQRHSKIAGFGVLVLKNPIGLR